MEINLIQDLYLSLLKKHGKPKKYWPQWCASKKTLKEREIIAIGAILTQRTSWRNAHLALLALKRRRMLSIKKIANLKDFPILVESLKPAGFYNTKPKRLFAFCSFITSNYGGLSNFMKEDTKVAREKLLEVYGIGPETADTILLYACDKPTFVIDEYTRRLAIREKLANDLKYNSLKKLFERSLTKDSRVYQNFHALIIITQKGEVKSKMTRV